MQLEEAASFARKVGWLSQQPASFQDRFLEFAELRHYWPNSEVYRLGEEAEDMWGLVEGELSVLMAPTIATPILVHIARPGWWIGDTALVSDTPRRVSLIARCDSWLLRVAKSSIDQLAQADPQTWRRIAQITVGHLDHALRVIADLTNRDVNIRVANTLRRLANVNQQSSSGQAAITLSRDELGELAHLTRNALAPILKEFEQSGFIRCGYRVIEVLDAAALGHYVSAREERAR